MENISKAIKALFVKMSGDEILKYAGFISLDKKEHIEEGYNRLDAHIPESIVVNKLLHVDFESTIDQLNIVHQILQDKWVVKDKSNMSLQFRNNDSVFNVLLHFASKCLIVKDGEPLCLYRTLLRWHMITELVGEDLLTTAFVASYDIKLKKRRNTFDWNAYLGHDCKELNYIFEKPMAELHMHLKGSSYNFDLSWSCLMNHIGNMQSRFETDHPLHQYIDPDKTLYEKVRRAAAIRYYLAVAVGCVDDELSLAQLHYFLNNELDVKNLSFRMEERRTRKEIGVEDIDILERIDESRKKTKMFTREKFEQAKSTQHFNDQLADNDIIDYIPVLHYENEPVENKALAPERAFMYSVFSAIYGGKEETDDIATLFYAYLAYKTYFRNEIIQLNERVGFANFASYEERLTTSSRIIIICFIKLQLKAFWKKEETDLLKQGLCQKILKRVLLNHLLTIVKKSITRSIKAIILLFFISSNKEMSQEERISIAITTCGMKSRNKHMLSISSEVIGKIGRVTTWWERSLVWMPQIPKCSVGQRYMHRLSDS